jgi:hypothetical protein
VNPSQFHTDIRFLRKAISSFEFNFLFFFLKECLPILKLNFSLFFKLQDFLLSFLECTRQ